MGVRIPFVSLSLAKGVGVAVKGGNLSWGVSVVRYCTVDSMFSQHLYSCLQIKKGAPPFIF